MKPDYRTINIKKLWRLHDKDVDLRANKTWVGTCPWIEFHEVVTSECTITPNFEGWPTFSCDDPDCADREFKDLISFWHDAAKCCDKSVKDDEDDGDPTSPKAKSKYKVHILGFSPEGLYYYQSSMTGHIVALTAAQHVEMNFYAIVPDPTYWKQPEIGGSSEGMSWKRAARNMMLQCHNQGYYWKSETRGSGIFLDKGRIVVNLGSTLLVCEKGGSDFVVTSTAEFRGEFIYASPSRVTLPEAATKAELNTVLPLMQKLPFESPGGALILIGAIVAGYMAGALDWRPHFWMTGPAATGKSSIMNLVLGALQPYRGAYFKGDTSAAGIRDATKNSSGMVLVDELEKMSGTNEKLGGLNIVRRVDAMIEMMRSSSETSTASTAKGDPNGKGRQDQIRCCAFFSSIFPGVELPQDFRRFCFIRLSNKGSKTKKGLLEWENTREELKQTFTHDFAMKLYSWAAYNSRYILDLVKFFRSAMITFSKDSGECDQWATTLACAWALTRFQVTPSTQDVLDMFNACYDTREDDLKDRAELDHGRRAMGVLRTTIPPGERFNIGEQIESATNALLRGGLVPEGVEGWLDRYGIHVVAEGEKRDIFIIIAANHSQLGKIMSSGGYSAYVQPLLTYHGAVRGMSDYTFAGADTTSVIKIPVEKRATKKATQKQEMSAEEFVGSAPLEDLPF